MSFSHYLSKMVEEKRHSPRGLKIVNKRVVAKATLYGFVYWYNTKRKTLTNKKEQIWQKQ